MENNSNLSLKNRRALVIVFFITLVITFALIPFMSKPSPTSFLWIIQLGLLIINQIIGFYLISKTAVYTLGGQANELDERVYTIRLKAQRDAYCFILLTVIVALPFGSQFFANDAFMYAIILLIYMTFLFAYLPTMLIAWQEKEV